MMRLFEDTSKIRAAVARKAKVRTRSVELVQGHTKNENTFVVMAIIKGGVDKEFEVFPVSDTRLEAVEVNKNYICWDGH